MTVEVVIGRCLNDEVDSTTMAFEDIKIVDFDEFMIDGNPVIKKGLLD